MARAPNVAVEVVYALSDRVVAASAQVEAGTTVSEVIERVGFGQLVPDVALDHARVGIFGRIVSRDTPVRDGDRIEIYRPLVADPKQARRQRSRRKRGSGT